MSKKKSGVSEYDLHANSIMAQETTGETTAYQVDATHVSKDLDSSKSPKGKMPGSEGNHGQTSEHMQ